VSESRDHRHEISFSPVVIQRLHNHLSASPGFSTCLLYNSLLSQMINYDVELGGCLGRHPRAIFCKRPATQEGDGFDEPKSRFQCVVSAHASSPDFLRLYAFFRSYERAVKSSEKSYCLRCLLIFPSNNCTILTYSP
jgi:hypothetical protein